MTKYQKESGTRSIMFPTTIINEISINRTIKVICTDDAHWSSNSIIIKTTITRTTVWKNFKTTSK